MTSLTRLDNRVIISCVNVEDAVRWFEYIAEELTKQQEEQERRPAIIETRSDNEEV